MKIIGYLLLATLLFLCGLAVFSRRLLYFPAAMERGRLEYIQHHFNTVEEVTVPAQQGVVLHGWIIKKDMGNLPVVFYFGGNAEEVSLNLEAYRINLDANVILINYRGYGKSQGRPEEKALKADALAVYETMVSRYNLDVSRTVAWGRSIGSSMACYLASQKKLKGLILTCPFDSIEQVAAAYYPAWLVRLVLRDRHQTTDFSSTITAPTLILAAGQDEVIPRQRTLGLYDSLTCTKELVTIETAGHNTICGFNEYFPAVNRFLSGL